MVDALGLSGGSFTGRRSDPGTMYRTITPTSDGSVSSTNVLPEGPCRFIVAYSSGTVSFYDHTTFLVSSYPLRVGENPVGAKQVFSAGSTMTAVAPPTMLAGY
jgi:hypothetical protein